MKTLNIIPTLLLLISCTEPQTSQNAFTESRLQNLDTIQKVIANLDHIEFAAKQYADSIIAGNIQPIDNEQTFAWLDSLQSESKTTRLYAFKVYKAMATKSDGALSEAICGHIKNYFYSCPQEFLSNYSTLTEEEKKQTLENLAFEFYASGTDYKKDLDYYFEKIKSKCKDCTPFNINQLEDLRANVEAHVGQMTD